MTVTQCARTRAPDAGAIGRDACRQALDRLGESLAMRETAALVGDVDEDGWERDRAVVDDDRRGERRSAETGGRLENETLALARAPRSSSSASAAGGHAPGVARRRCALVRAAPRRAAARPHRHRPKRCRCCSRCCGGAIRASRARRSSALGGIDDPAAARAIHTVLRAATGELRAR